MRRRCSGSTAAWRGYCCWGRCWRWRFTRGLSREGGRGDDHSAPSNLARARDTAVHYVAAVAAFVALSAIHSVGVAAADSVRAVWIGGQNTPPPPEPPGWRPPQPPPA